MPKLITDAALRAAYRAETGRIIPAGIVLYQGMSVLDGETPIVVIATGLDRSSANEKTGPLVQTWILRQDVEPTAAVYSAQDAPICGACPFASGNGCYVNTGQAPLAVYRAWKRGVYEAWNPDSHRALFEHNGLRIGSYGDPCAVPYRLWATIAAQSAFHVGYTHQWADGRFWRFRRLLMASTHSQDENERAASLGWRTFRTKTPGLPIAQNEIVCPASAERGFARDCATCRACNGAADGIGRRSIVLDVHGSAPVVLKATRAVESLS